MSSIIRGFAYAALASCLLSRPSHAGDAVSGHLVISQAWSRATPGGAKVARGYLTIENRGSAPDRMVSGSTELAKRLEIHEIGPHSQTRASESPRAHSKASAELSSAAFLPCGSWRGWRILLVSAERRQRGDLVG
jgi:hypothetical protein